MLNISKNEFVTNITLLFVLGVCLWIGWSDYLLERPEVTQDEIRESIRLYIRSGIQVIVQFMIPTAVLTYFARKLWRGRSEPDERQ